MPSMQHPESSGTRELGQKQSTRDIADFQSNSDTQTAMEWKFQGKKPLDLDRY